MKKIIILVITIVGIIGILVLFGAVNINSNDQSPKAFGPAVLSASENSFDFGTVSMAAGLVKRDFLVKNAADKEIIISKIYTSCMCTEAVLKMNGESFGPFGMPGHGAMPKLNKKIGAGEEAVVEVIFDPAAHGPAGIGMIERVVYLESSSGLPLELKIKANVVP